MAVGISGNRWGKIRGGGILRFSVLLMDRFPGLAMLLGSISRYVLTIVE